MDKTIAIGLNGHVEQFQLNEDAYDGLRSYLDRAAARLPDEASRAEVLADLERSVGDKLAELLGSEHRPVTGPEMAGILDQIGAVDPADGAAQNTDPSPASSRQFGQPRRLHRIREGQQLAGVCNGIAEYTQVRVDWVRTGFVLASLGTAGLFMLVYVALIFIMPVDSAQPARATSRR